MGRILEKERNKMQACQRFNKDIEKDGSNRMMREIQSFGEAIIFLRKSLNGIDFIGRFDDNSIVAKMKGIRSLIQFKREYYRNFVYHFPDVKKEDGKSYGWAQIMSLSSLNRALIEDIEKLVFITPDGKMYSCYTRLFKNFYLKNKTDVPHLKGEIAMPLDFFERVNEAPKGSLDSYR